MSVSIEYYHYLSIFPFEKGLQNEMLRERKTYHAYSMKDCVKGGAYAPVYPIEINTHVEHTTPYLYPEMSGISDNRGLCFSRNFLLKRVYTMKC